MTSTLIHSIRIFDGHSVLTESGFLYFKDGLIHTVAAGAPPAGLEATNTIDGAGHTILPGLIDAHVHCHGDSRTLALCLKFGVTTVLDMFSDAAASQGLKKLASEKADYADIRSAGFGAVIKNGWPGPIVMATMPDKEVARKMVESWPLVEEGREAEWITGRVEEGSDYIKLMQEDGANLLNGPFPTPRPSMQAALVKAAHANGILTVAHAMSQKATMTVLEAGTDGLAHCFYDEKPSAELVDLYKKTGAFLIPTLVVSASITGENVQDSKDILERDVVSKRVGHDEKECFCGRVLLARGGSVEHSYETVRVLKKNGVDILAGTDAAKGLHGTVPGLSLHQELGLYVHRCGFTGVEALISATSTTARRFSLNDRGRIAEGLRADLLMVKGDPTSDIGCTMDIAGVWRGGVALEL
ncbi:hypothetical protein LSUE1_G008422 [Lachnellula suecica]|uniref:Amidohydrolase-related domain-containing protein n=1 Tax=Lachnellula suecica TaxID=602035 RepID=A0A8T9C0L9_9HELO|nr:hypothetical protein LSUE1_G008422 [Lachnellula suecica]